MHKAYYARLAKVGHKMHVEDTSEYLAGVAMSRGCFSCGIGVYQCLGVYHPGGSLRGKLRAFRPCNLDVAKASVDFMVVVCKNCEARINSGEMTCKTFQ